MKKINKKAFTLVELLVVIAILAVLATVAIIGYGSFIEESKVSNDNTVVTELNRFTEAYIAGGGEVNTVQDVAEELKKDGFLISTLKPSATKDYYAFNIKTKKFMVITENDPELPNTAQGKADIFVLVGNEKAFAFASPTEGDHYSMYLQTSYAFDSTLDIKAGLDVGEVDNINTINYDRSIATDGIEAVIRTNGFESSLTINGYIDSSNASNSDTIKHYGLLGSLNVIKCATSSYHENGKVAFAEIAKGRIVLEDGSNVGHIHINAKDENTFDEVVIKDNGAEALPKEITRDQVEVTIEKVPVVTVESKEGSETVYVYPYVDSTSTQTGTTEKTSVQNSTISTTLGMLVLDNGLDAGEKAMSNNEKEEKQVTVVETSKDELINGDVIRVTLNNVTSTMSLSEFRDRVNEGLLDGCTAVLFKDVDLSNISTWKPIGTSDHPFNGVFDGANHSISDLRIEHPESDFQGLFGYVVSNADNENADSLDDVWNDTTYTFDDTAFAETNYAAVVKNLKVSGNILGSTWVGGIAAYAKNAYLYNIEFNGGIVESSNLGGDNRVGAIVGEMDAVVIKNCSTSSEVTLKGGNIGGIAGFISYKSHPDRFKLKNAIVDCTNNANIIYTGTSGYRVMGSIMGYARGGEGIVFSGCVNNGTLSDDGEHFTQGAGMVGYSDSTLLFNRCINNGEINITRDIYHNDEEENRVHQNGIGGISGYGSVCTKYYKCENHANITGATRHMAGIVGWVYGSANTEGYQNGYIMNCVNTGILNNTKVDQSDIYMNEIANYYVSSLANIQTNLAGNYANVEELQSLVNTVVTNSIDFTGVTVANTEGTLTLPNNEFVLINIPTKVADNIKVVNFKHQTCELTSNDATIHFNGNNSGKTLKLISSNSTIIIDKDSSVGGFNLTSNSSTTKIEVLNYGLLNGRWADAMFCSNFAAGGRLIIKNYAQIEVAKKLTECSSGSQLMDLEVYLYQGSYTDKATGNTQSVLSDDLHNTLVFKAYNIENCIYSVSSYHRLKDNTNYVYCAVDTSLTA